MPTQEEVNEFLEELREGGSINMFLAPRVLVNYFKVDEKTAREMWAKWTETYYSV